MPPIEPYDPEPEDLPFADDALLQVCSVCQGTCHGCTNCWDTGLEEHDCSEGPDGLV